MDGGYTKKMGILGIVIGICIILTSCTLNTNEKDNSKLINSVKQIETYDYKLNTFQITYDDYKKNTKKFVTSYFNKDDDDMLVYNGKLYKCKDLVGMSLKEYKELGDKVFSKPYETAEIKRSAVNISNVYYSKEDPFQFKYVYSKYIIEIEKEEITIYKRYSFLKQDNEWKVTTIDKITETKDYKYDKTKLSGYTTYNNKPVEYANNINLLEIQ